MIREDWRRNWIRNFRATCKTCRGILSSIGLGYKWKKIRALWLGKMWERVTRLVFNDLLYDCLLVLCILKTPHIYRWEYLGSTQTKVGGVLYLRDGKQLDKLFLGKTVHFNHFAAGKSAAMHASTLKSRLLF